MKKRSIKKSIYAICAALGFITSVFTHTLASGEDVILHPAIDAFLYGKEEKQIVSAEKFSDVASDAWYFPYVDMLVKNGVINGISETEYAPNGTFTAAEACAVITRYLGLEEYAVSARKELVSASSAGGDLWYSGYVQTLHDTGIIKEGEFSVSNSNGYVMINDESAFSAPLERHKFAVLITRSFDISTDKVKSNNLYPEICDNGNNLITGGAYDDSVTEYANDITDYWSIPEQSRMDVLKAYYNGIFNGDEAGNFNPTSLLTRAEMSKVIAVIKDSDLRVRKEYRSIPEAFVIPDDKYKEDGWGNTVIDRNYSYEILKTAADGISCDVKSKGIDVGYIPAKAPEGYFFDVRFYSKTENIYTESAKAPISQSEVMIVKELSTPRVMMMLRNCDTAEVEGVIRIDISSDGNVIYDNLFKPVL